MSTSTEQQPSALRRIAADPVSRRRFFAVGGGTSAALFLAACGDDDDETTSSSTTTMPDDETASQFGEGDIGIANYALTLEYLEADFYDQVAEERSVQGRRPRADRGDRRE